MTGRFMAIVLYIYRCYEELHSGDGRIGIVIRVEDTRLWGRKIIAQV